MTRTARTLTRGIAVVILLAVAFAVMALAGRADASMLPSCQPGQVKAVWNGADGFTVSWSGPHTGCVATLASYTVPATYDGGGFDKSATPQAIYAQAQVLVTDAPTAVTVKVPACGPYQVDLVTGTPRPVITWPSGSGPGGIAGKLLKGQPCSTGTPTGTPTTSHPTSSPIPPVKSSPPATGHHTSHAPAGGPTGSSTGGRTGAAVAAVRELPRTGGLPWTLLTLGLVCLVVGAAIVYADKHTPGRH